MRLLNCITDYQRFWSVDEQLCMELENEKRKIMPKDDREDEAHVCDAHFAMGITFLAFKRYDKAVKSFMRIVDMQEWILVNAFQTLFRSTTRSERASTICVRTERRF